MIEFTKSVIKGDGWQKTIYAVTRNGVEIGTLFARDDGSFTYEGGGDRCEDFTSLEQAKDKLGRTKKTFIETLAEKGLV